MLDACYMYMAFGHVHVMTYDRVSVGHYFGNASARWTGPTLVCVFWSELICYPLRVSFLGVLTALPVAGTPRGQVD